MCCGPVVVVRQQPFVPVSTPCVPLRPRFSAQVSLLPVLTGLQDLYKSCARGGGVKRGDVCYGMLRAAACVDESDHHALMYVRHGQTVREHGVDERSVGRP